MPSYTIESVQTGRFVSPQSQGIRSPVVTESNPVGVGYRHYLSADTLS